MMHFTTEAEKQIYEDLKELSNCVELISKAVHDNEFTIATDAAISKSRSIKEKYNFEK